MHPHSENLGERIHRVINRLIFLEKRSVFQLGGLKLHPSEIHLMLVIRRQPDLSAGEMAQRLGVSNGAVSQTLARLVKKGVITKAKDPSLKNRVTAIFTESGNMAIKRFEEERASASGARSFANYLDSLTEEESEVIAGLVSHMEEFLEELE
jgi:DNA-binding MarR family transcriptional regulator